MTTPERKLQESIVQAINKAPLGAWAIPNIVVKKARKTFTEITGLGTGSPDIYVAIAPNGHLWLEVKCKETGGKCSTAQNDWHAKAKSFGVTVVTVWSVQEAIDAVCKARAEAAKLAALTLGGSLALAGGKALGRALLRSLDPVPSVAPMNPHPSSGTPKGRKGSPVRGSPEKGSPGEQTGAQANKR